MVRQKLRVATCVSGALFASLVTFVACSGGGNGVSPTAMQPNKPAPSPQGQSISIPLTQSVSIALPTVGGIKSAIALPKNNAPAGANLNVGVSIGSPPGMATIPVRNASAFEYFSLTSSADVTFNGFPKMTLTLPSTPASQGNFYVWMYNIGTGTWTDLGTVTVSGSTMSFGGGATNVTMFRGVTYVVAPFTGSPGAACPTPTPSPCPTPPIATSEATPASTKLYVTNTCVNGTQVVPYVAVYDENGNLVPIAGTFPNLDNLAPGLAFDSANQNLYFDVNSFQTAVKVYDTNGNQVTTSETFPANPGGVPSGIAFDAVNQHFYVAFGAANSIQVYDESGDSVSTSGAFPNLNSPSAIVFDSSNHQLYVTNVSTSTITVYDEDGNQISTSGTFPHVVSPLAIAFDTSNRHLYVANLNDTITVYDEDGNQVTVTGGFPRRAAGADDNIAFDPSNQHLYVTTGSVRGSVNNNGVMLVYDQDGNTVTTSGHFPFLNFPSGIVVVP